MRKDSRDSLGIALSDYISSLSPRTLFQRAQIIHYLIKWKQGGGGGGGGGGHTGRVLFVCSKYKLTYKNIERVS